MATYNFHGGNQEMETTDGLHTLYLMNPNYTSHHHQQAATTRQNMILLNSSLPHALSHSHVSHAPPQPQSQFLTIPFAHPISADDPTRSGNSFHYNLWGSGSGGHQVVEVSSSGALGVAAAATHHPYQIQIDNDTDMFRRPAVVSPTINQQGLSLSLSSSQPRLGGGGNNGNSYNNSNSSMSITAVVNNGSSSGGGGFGSTSSAAQAAEDSNGVQNLIMGSKYLKAAQELLDEVVNVGKGSTTTTITANDTVKKEKEKVVQMDNNNNNINGESEAAAAGGGGGSNNRAASSELTVTQRQELQMKKTKLISMLDEVEQTYRQYNHQMKTVVSSFEQVAGLGSARSYTSLALTTISKQFRCLKDAIMSQIKQISKSLGEEEDCLGVKAEGSRLRMIDHQLRQQRALQQLGMIQHNAWRPQRGLPERAVSVLRAWLFENFLHPYPKDSDKHILAKRTGLTRNQVSNWFINARVRLWKPMVEEMYLEEVKDQPAAEQKGSNSNQDNNNNALVTIAKSSPADKQQQHQNAADHISNSTTMSTSPNNNNIASSFNALAPPPGFTLASSDMDGLVQYKKPRGTAVQETTQNHSPSSILSASGEMSFSRQDQSSNLTAKFGAYSTGYDNNNNNNNGGGFGAYHQFGDQVGSRFNPDEQLFHHGNNNNNGSVSLTLGLPPGENLAHNNYFSGHGYDRGLQMGGNGAADDFCGINNTNNPQNSNMGFQNMDIQNRKNYAAQLLPDFVA